MLFAICQSYSTKILHLEAVFQGRVIGGERRARPPGFPRGRSRAEPRRSHLVAWARAFARRARARGRLRARGAREQEDEAEAVVAKRA